jgi:hypothetical protein
LFDILIMEFLSDWHFSGGGEGDLSLPIYIILYYPKPQTPNSIKNVRINNHSFSAYFDFQ